MARRQVNEAPEDMSSAMDRRVRLASEGAGVVRGGPFVGVP